MMKANRKSLTDSEEGYTYIIPLILSVVIVFALLYVGSFIGGTLRNELVDSYGVVAGSPFVMENISINMMSNISSDFEGSMDIIQVAVIITILATAIGAIFMLARFR